MKREEKRFMKNSKFTFLTSELLSFFCNWLNLLFMLWLKLMLRRHRACVAKSDQQKKFQFIFDRNWLVCLACFRDDNCFSMISVSLSAVKFIILVRFQFFYGLIKPTVVQRKERRTERWESFSFLFFPCVTFDECCIHWRLVEEKKARKKKHFPGIKKLLMHCLSGDEKAWKKQIV